LLSLWCYAIVDDWIRDYVITIYQLCKLIKNDMMLLWIRIILINIIDYEISPLLLELPPCGQVQVIVLSVQLLREWPFLTVSSRSLWYVTGWGYLLCMLHSFTWIFMIYCLNETNSFETFYGACVPNVLWFISIFQLQCFEVIWLNYYLTVSDYVICDISLLWCVLW